MSKYPEYASLVKKLDVVYENDKRELETEKIKAEKEIEKAM